MSRRPWTPPEPPRHGPGCGCAQCFRDHPVPFTRGEQVLFALVVVGLGWAAVWFMSAWHV